MDVRKIAEIAAPVFAARGWTWWGSANPPDADRIAECLTEMISLVVGDTTSVSTGRLVVRRPVYEIGEVCDVEVLLRLSEQE